jgi:TetR/AcrR family transcriptional regulator
MENEMLLDHENAERILEEGWHLFQQKGYRGVTVDELCARCQLSKPTLYYYFRDKENLFVQVLQYKLHGFRTAAEQPGTLAERLQAVAVVILDSFQNEYSTLLRDRENLKRPESLKKIREAFHSELFGPLISMMRLGIVQGELKKDSPETFTLIFLGMINNFIGKAADMQLDNTALAKKITGYFLEGAKTQ